ncbi:unnamed protein product [Haemonchus placei]|uniref:Formylglycine-generating enzyme family protein n=1 Tax=Haemonchus placei TaxID=6290 RepID=A0A0N4X3N2_HAEPC|nr:unnamed protein product [Haemonchus placei]
MSVFNRSIPEHTKRWGDSGKPCRSQPTWRDCSAIYTPQVVDRFWGNHIGWQDAPEFLG